MGLSALVGACGVGCSVGPLAGLFASIGLGAGSSILPIFRVPLILLAIILGAYSLWGFVRKKNMAGTIVASCMLGIGSTLLGWQGPSIGGNVLKREPFSSLAPGITVLTTDGLNALKGSFNSKFGGPRMFIFFTANCPACDVASVKLQKMFSQMEKPFVLYVIWEPVPGSGYPETPPTQGVLSLLHDPRVHQIWDSGHLISTVLRRVEKEFPSSPSLTYLRTDKREDGVLYDTVLIYPSGSQWAETLPPTVFVKGGVEAALPEIQKRILEL